jgi:hypothetical protein
MKATPTTRSKYLVYSNLIGVAALKVSSTGLQLLAHASVLLRAPGDFGTSGRHFRHNGGSDVRIPTMATSRSDRSRPRWRSRRRSLRELIIRLFSFRPQRSANRRSRDPLSPEGRHLVLGVGSLHLPDQCR